MSTLKVFELQASFELKERYKSLSHDSTEGDVDITHTRTHTVVLSEQWFARVLKAL